MESQNQSIKALIGACEQELVDLDYGKPLRRKISRYWNEFSLWMERNGIETLTPAVGRQYYIEAIGSDILSDIEKRDRIRHRSVRMLISFQKDGCFEFRAPSAIPLEFHGKSGKLMESYLDNLRQVQQFADSTIAEKRLRLHEFNSYLEGIGIQLCEVCTKTLTDFALDQGYSLTKTRLFSTAVKQLFRYAYDVGAIAVDLSFIVMPVSKGPEKLPSTYTENEIKSMLSAIERGSAIGKRDYLVLLLAAEYGWRASDITSFQFNWIDWDKNTISFDQHKTSIAVQFPLLSSVGNAIIEYLKYGRPETEAQEIIVGHDTAKRGGKLTSPTIHSIVTRYIRAANIENWKQKKHGSHALRFSLATNMLKNNVSIPIISTVLGHQSTESTKRYISLDIEQLKKCPLPIPPLNTDIFEVAV
jgi:site-specific recombinase XerD